MKILKKEGAILSAVGLAKGVSGLLPNDKFCDIHASPFFCMGLKVFKNTGKIHGIKEKLLLILTNSLINSSINS
jgi:hypothetical protein